MNQANETATTMARESMNAVPGTEVTRASLQRVIAVLLCAWSAAPPAAQDAVPAIGDKESLTVESRKLDAILQRQSEEDAAAQEWEERRTRDAQLRAMYREAVLLSELNVAWIEDQLDHWDCRVAEKAVVDVQQRQAELSDYIGKLQSLCAQVGTQDAAQQRVCHTQAEQTAQAQQELKDLAQRYRAECPAAPMNPVTEQNIEEPMQ